MSYEKTSGLGVSNQYGPRDTGGVEGIIKTEGLYNEYAINFDGDGPLGFLFPVLDGVRVTGVDVSFATTGTETLTIGGVNVLTATEGSNVAIADDNTGVVASTEITAGTVVVKFKRIAQ